jgi:pimeloyl-ACP methyl ester carboxylesterase
VRPVPAVRPPGFTDPPAGKGPGRYQGQPVSWRPCSEGLQCAQVLVPLDYARPDGTAITLALAKRPATGSNRRGSLFINPGGPGGSGVGYVSYFRNTGLEDYDIVGFDPRGVAGSTPVTCRDTDLAGLLSMDVSPDDPAEQDALVEADRQFGAGCLERSGPLLQHISTVEVARDLDLLRGLVGDERLNFFGASYGTQVGATYATLFPRQVGRMVLDGAVNITQQPSVSQAEGFDRALTAFADWCADRNCSLGRTREEVLAAVQGFVTRLDGQSLRVGQRELTQQLGVAGIVYVLYASAEEYKYLLLALDNAINKGDGTVLLRLADQLSERNAKGEYGQLNFAFPAVRCLDEPDRGVQGEIDLARAAAAQAPVLGPVIGPDLVCALWPVPAVAQRRLEGAGAAPIVVLGNTGDPATPYEYAVSMAQQLKSGVLVTYRGQGHTSYGKSECVQRLVVGYFAQGTVPEDGTTC